MAVTNKPGRKPTTPQQAEDIVENVNDIKPDGAAESDETKDRYVVKQLDPAMYVTVKNGFNGTLVYKSKKTGERFVWPQFGDEQDIELQELKAAKNNAKSFFENNWFLFDDPAVVEWLGMSKFYKHTMNVGGFDHILTRSADEIAKTIPELTDGQKKTLAFRAKQMIEEGKIDSLKVITVLEDNLGVQLIEREK